MVNKPRSAFALIIALYGCGGVAPQVSPDMDVALALMEVNACNTAAYHALIGAPVAQVAATAFAEPIRILQPGVMIDSTYVPERLTLIAGRNGLISDLACG